MTMQTAPVFRLLGMITYACSRTASFDNSPLGREAAMRSDGRSARRPAVVEVTKNVRVDWELGVSSPGL